MVTFHNGNILDSGADIICHQVNCQGAMNSGVAKAIRQKWPKVYTEYRSLAKNLSSEEFCDEDLSWTYMLGHIQSVLIPKDKGFQIVINMFAQNGYGYDGKRYTSYDAFWSCLGEIRKSVAPGTTIAFPARIGCMRGGANWDVILTMIKEVLGADYSVEIWDYDKG